ncbi:hypothetical protein M378DRAFT_175588 [Amanita muscaria Koide BX008]|uniref:Up-regulated during septation protein 1 domain-containing protein n=1 Tax=Amanita muscaria (strain Koide BX008) TaxID=946122 RepID=A0A0C2X7K2_AMAMK|nr:hypothetical protein M378DRAFT_175588 [Amanita muscaria Koide BX008]
MNGIRRLLASSPTSSPTHDIQHAPYSPSSPTASLSRESSTAVRREKPQPPIPKTNGVVSQAYARNKSSTSAGSPTSSSYIGPARVPVRKSVPKVEEEQEWKRSSTPLNTRDELLISLLASEAVVDSREFDILSSEEVEELKKEHLVLESRLGAATRKLALETKIRDAAKSLVRANAANKKISQKSEEQLEAANKRVDTAQTELSRISQRATEVHRRLMEHRAGVLSLSVRRMEKKLAPKLNDSDSGYNSPINSATPSLSPSRSIMSPTTPSTRFSGAHLFAGHVDAVVPKRQVAPDAAAAEITTLEAKLRAAMEALAAAGKKQAELQRDLSLLRLEKQEVSTSMTLELQGAEETISALERELPRLENLEQQHLEEKKQWEEERAQLQQQSLRAGELDARLKEVEARKGDAALIEKVLSEEKEKNRRELEKKEADIRRLEQTLEQEREQWGKERANMEDEKMEDLARLQDELERQKEDDFAILKRAGEELEDGLDTMQGLLDACDISSRDPSLPGLVQAISEHIEKIQTSLQSFEQAEEEWTLLRQKLQDDVQGGLEKQELLQREVEEARRARDVATAGLNKRLNEPLPPMEINVPLDTDVGKVTSILLPIWAILPSPDVRAAKFSTRSPTVASSPTPKSIADLDIGSLRSLHDSSLVGSSQAGAGGAFSFEAFAARVQALIVDDRSLIERLVRVAQAHDLLKKNAERAQKLAQDGANLLETYQKQVKTLEGRNTGLASRVIQLQEDIQYLHEGLDQLTMEKQELEAHTVEQAEALRELTEANESLSARTLTLAEEAAREPEKERKELEIQLADCRDKLQAAQTELNAFQTSEQTQRIALMDELHSIQTENDRLRDQLRSMKR